MRILIVNADPLINGTLHDMLQAPGVTVVTAPDNHQGIAMLQRSSLPVVAIVDLRLSDWPTSYQFLAQVAAIRDLAERHAVVLLLSTAETVPAGMSSVMQQLHLFFAAKPPNQAALRSTISMAAKVTQRQDVTSQPTHKVAASTNSTFLPSTK